LLISILKCLFNSETSSLHWKSIFRIAWGQQNAFLHWGDIQGPYSINDNTAKEQRTGEEEEPEEEQGEELTELGGKDGREEGNRDHTEEADK